MTVNARDLRRLLTSALPDPNLVLLEGRLEVVKVDDLDTDRLHGAMLLVSRAELQAQGVSEESTDQELELAATRISTAVDEPGG